MHCLSVVIRKEAYFIRQPCHKTAFESISFGRMHEQDIVAVDLGSILMGCFLHAVICKEHPPRLTLTDFLQVPFIERDILPVI